MHQLLAERPATALEAMLAAGLDERQILNLVRLRHAVFAGQRSEVTPEHKRLLFGRYLYEQGFIQS